MKILVIWNDDASGFVEDLKSAYGNQDAKSIAIEVANNVQSLVCILKPTADKTKSTKKEPFIPGRIFILVELDWKKQDWYGYSVFQDYILTYNDIFKSIKATTQITFVSEKSQSEILADLNTIGGTKYLIASHYNHILHPTSIEILKNLPYNSKFHYDFLRQVTLIEYSIIGKIEHAIDKLRSGDEVSIWNNIKRDIKCLKPLLSDKLIKTIDNYDINHAIQNKDQIKGDIREEYYKSLPPEKQIGFRKSEYKVLIIEDDSLQLKFLKEILKKFFVNVHGILVNRNLSLTDVLNELKHFEIAFIDLLFEDRDGYLSYSGFDIVHQIQFQKDFNHIAFRLFSNMPRHLIGSIINISINHIIPKKFEDQTKRELIGLEINSIIEEVREKEKSKLYEYGSNIGPFYRSGLKTELFNEKKNDLEGFNEKYWKKAYHFACLFKEDNLTESTPGWTKELHSPKSKEAMKLSEFMDKHLPYVLAHRLIVFYFLLNEKNARNKPLSLELNHFSNKWQPFVGVDIIKQQKAYFNTRLGIHCITDSSGENDPYIEIKLMNLFPEEIDWLNKNLSKNTNRITIKENNGLFYNWLLKISNESVFPSGTWPSTIDEWSYIDFDNFISTLFESANQYKDLIEILYDAYTIFNPNEDSLPKSTIESVNKLCSFDPDDIG